ncbi:MAG: UvrB/UvrC motif-containing protein [Defluviitaleaceae bacterium]|nr:UvrB/UvrC motif-containing protein [Defluviitaleaceae bacterium]
MDNEIKNFLQYIFEIIEGLERDAGETDFLVCSNCATTYSGFKKSGKMGCAVCYTAFGEQITQALKNIHSSSVHTGKIPNSKNNRFSELITQRELNENRLLLKKAIEAENYEDAARYRDIINDLQSGIKES